MQNDEENDYLDNYESAIQLTEDNENVLDKATKTTTEQIKNALEAALIESDEDTTIETEADIESAVRPHKFVLKLKKNENGNILTIHHTITNDEGAQLRVRLGVFCFNNKGTQFVTIDKRGNIFAFDLAMRKYWRPTLNILKASVIVPSMQHDAHYYIGSKVGQLLLLDIENSKVLHMLQLSSSALTEISFADQPLQRAEHALVHAGAESILVNLQNFTATHRLDFDELHMSLKFASYLPNSEQIFTCFTNDAVHIWSGISLNTIRVAQPIKARDRKLRLMDLDKVPVFTLTLSDATVLEHEFELNCPMEDYTNGLITAYSYPPDGSHLCLTTVDSYLLLLNANSLELQQLFRLRNFVLKQCAFLPKPNEMLILGLTSAGQVVLLDCRNTEFKLVVQASAAVRMCVSNNGKLLAVLSDNSKLELWNTFRLYNTLKAQEKCVQMLRMAFKQPKPVTLSDNNECFNQDLRKLLKRSRLLSILKEFGCYPAKYRALIWSVLLQLPYNRNEFELLLKRPIPAIIQQRAQKLKLKSELAKRTLIKVWSSLAHWSKVFAYSEFVPQLIFPFVKIFPKNAFVAFEICVTLLLNHFQLFFEFHPMPPSNYLGICQNVLQHCDPELAKFYVRFQLEPIDYFWPLLSTAFSEVLDEEQWLCLWDNMLSVAPHFAVFVVVAYNMLQREVIMRLPDKRTIVQYFHEQNALDVNKLIAKAFFLLSKCPEKLHPQRYFADFEGIPVNVYPKFLKFPQQWVAKQEDEMLALQRKHSEIDVRIRQLEFEEQKMLQQLESGLKAEEHAKRMQEMEKLYRDTIQREEQRIALQSQMLHLYQKELRNRKTQVLATLQESERRKKAMDMERELELLRHSIEKERMRNDTNIALAEEAVRDEALELLSQRFQLSTHTMPLSQKYFDDLQKLYQQRTMLHSNMEQATSYTTTAHQTQTKPKHSDLELIEREIENITRELKNIAAS